MHHRIFLVIELQQLWWTVHDWDGNCHVTFSRSPVRNPECYISWTIRNYKTIQLSVERGWVVRYIHIVFTLWSLFLQKLSTIEIFGRFFEHDNSLATSSDRPIFGESNESFDTLYETNKSFPPSSAKESYSRKTIFPYKSLVWKNYIFIGISIMRVRYLMLFKS